MSPYETYVMYVALKSHFNQKTYDYLKYNGKVKTSPDQFEKRVDKYFFHKLSKHKDPKGFLIANFICNEVFWIGEFSHDEQTIKNYNRWKGRIEGLKYLFTQEITKLFDQQPIQRWFQIENSSHPLLMVYYLRGEISPETFVILTDVIGCFSYWNKHLKGDIVWEQVSKLYVKYRPFIPYDKQEYKALLKTEMNRYSVDISG